MALDVVAERRSAAEDIRNVPGALLEVRQPTYTGEVRSGQSDTTTWALIEATYPRPLIEEMLVGSEQLLTMAALKWTNGAWGDVLTLVYGDLVKVDGKWLTVFQPGRVAPNGEPIIYEALVGLRKGKA